MGKYLTILLFLFVIPNVLFAQDDDALYELKSAYLHIQNENYQEAYPYYKKMLDQYPKEPIYHYYVGRCLLFIDKDPLQAIKYLRFASTKQVPIDVYYYLGRAYIKNYRFQKAIETLQLFEQNASKKELRNLQYEVYISIAKNGLYLTKYIREPLVYSKQLFNIDDFYKIYSFDDLDGSFIEQDEFFEPQDSMKTKSIIFVPNAVQIQDHIYFAKKNEKRDDSDIYRMIRLTDSTWSKPENLGEVINTPFDESYPFMHSDGTTLYFASKGHYSMGGYDIYKSTWDWNTQQWSEPENLDFPVNSPYDDFLFVPTPNKKLAFFASNRDTDFKSVMVYKLKLTSSRPYIELHNYQDIRKYAKLDVNIDVDDKSTEQGNTFKTSDKKLVKIKNNTDFKHKSAYDSLLNLAIQYQLNADSLRWIIEDKRSVFENTEHGQERAQLSNVIIELEREIYALQKKADNCYKRVRDIEQMNLASKKSIYVDEKEMESKESAVESRSTKIFIEPTSDSLTKSKLSIPDKEIEEEHLIETGLMVEKTSGYTKENPIPLNETMPDGIIYMIQLGAFSSEKSPVVFKGLSPLSCIKREDSSIWKYFAGKFLQLSEAEKALPTVRSKGFKDAYIVAFNSGDIISVKKAVSMESNEDRIPIIATQKQEYQEIDEPEDLSIIYVLKGQIEKRDSANAEAIKSALTEDLELYLESKEKSISFIIKSFSSYDNALPVKYKLEAILQKEVEIHAYFAENQIPLEQARKITK